VEIDLRAFSCMENGRPSPASRIPRSMASMQWSTSVPRAGRLAVT
jgi:hypothetical protein